MFFSWLRNRRRCKLLAQPFPAAWESLLAERFWPYRRLPAEIAERLRRRVRIFMAERTFTGCGGLALTEEMRLLTAAQAGLLIAGDIGDFQFERVPAILMYPGVYQTPVDEHGDGGDVRLGEAWYRGPVILSWPDVEAGARSQNNGRNLVYHEFAHQLDGLDGEMGGAPPLPTPADRQRWDQISQRELAQLRRNLEMGRPTLLDPYAAENPAEFFAVSTEYFFQQPHAFFRRHGELYELLALFYRLDPRVWAGAAAAPKRSAAPEPEEEEEEFEDSAEEARDWVAAAGLEADSPDAAFTRGLALLEEGRYVEAEQAFSRTLAAEPNDAEAYHHRALARLALQQLDSALEDCRQALALAPDDLDALSVRAQVYLARGRCEEAVFDATNILWRKPGDLDATATRGLARLELEDFAGALADFDSVLEQDPEDAEILLARAEALTALGREAEAAADRRRAEELDPQAEEACFRHKPAQTKRAFPPDTLTQAPFQADSRQSRAARAAD